MTFNKTLTIVFVLALAGVISMPANASEDDDSIALCLKSWDAHPFGKTPQYKTLKVPVKVFGMGVDPSDTTATETPSLVLVNLGVNVGSHSTYELLNPNGWYCLKTSTTVMGKVTIKAHCKAQLASTSTGVAVMGSGDKGVTVMGSTEVKLVGCK